MSGFGGFCPLPLRLGGSATEGWTVAQHARVAADLSALVAVAPFAVITASFVTRTGATTLLAYNGQHGVGAAQAPTLSWDFGVGALVVTWATQYTDDYGNSWPTNITRGIVGPHDTGAFCCAMLDVKAPNIVWVLHQNSGGFPVDGTITLAVW